MSLGVEYGTPYVLEGPPAGVAGQRLANPSFETNLSSWTFSAPSWTEGAATREALPFAGSTGTYVARLKGKKDATATARVVTFAITTPENVAAGQNYNANIKANIVDNLGTGFRLYLNWLTASGSLVETKGVTAFATGTGIVEFSLRGITAPALATKAQLVFEGASSVASDTFDVRLDAAEFREVGPRAVFNDSTDPDFVGALSPESSGLDSPDIREDANDLVEGDGGIHGNFWTGRRPVVLQGTIIASSATQRNERVSRLQRASMALREDATLTWQPLGASEAVSVSLRRQQPLRVTKGFVKEFQLPMVSASALICGTTANSKNVTEGLVWKEEEAWAATSAVESGSQTPTVTAWVNPGNAKAESGTWAKIEGTTGTSAYLYTSGYGLAIPATATIQGLIVYVRRKGSLAIDNLLSLTSDGISALGENKKAASVWGASVRVTYGSAVTLWGAGLTPAIINAPGFGVILQVKGSASPTAWLGEVDGIEIEPYWTNGPLSVVAENKGEADAYPVVKITGPITNFTLKNNTTGQSMVFAYTLLAGHTLTIDFNNRTILDNGVNAYSGLTFVSSTWWSLPPGSNTIELTGTARTNTTALEVEHRNSWI